MTAILPGVNDQPNESANPTEPRLTNRQTPFSEPFKAFIREGWEPYSEVMPDALPATAYTPARRAAVSAAFPGDRLVVPAGGLTPRVNDTDFLFRPHSAFAYLTGLGEDREPDAVLVFEPVPSTKPGEEWSGHEVTLYFKPRSPRTDPEFYADPRYGEMWVGQRESLEEMQSLTRLPCAPIADLDAVLARDADRITVRVVRDADATLTAKLDQLRRTENKSFDEAVDEEFAVMLSEMRLVKDEFEIEEIQRACDETSVAFEAVVAEFDNAVANGRGERWCEGIFALHARHRGNDVGYGSICAAGDHANTLHWTRNDGELRYGDLILMDMGIELESLYTADITRTLPISGRFTPAQRRVYEAVLEANQAAIGAARAGSPFQAVHDAAIRVIAEHLEAWGILPVSAEESLDPVTGGQHRRWMVHGTSHHLGIDVHDCAKARNEFYRQGVLREGMVITIEPGLYFKSTDLLAPEELRGIGVRIEDNIVITNGEPRILTDKLPRTADDIERWMAEIRG